MAISRKSLETLLDLVEIKLGCLEVWDMEDRKALETLQKCRREICGVLQAPLGDTRLEKGSSRHAA